MSCDCNPCRRLRAYDRITIMLLWVAFIMGFALFGVVVALWVTG